jgi:hypothetical protein
MSVVNVPVRLNFHRFAAQQTMSRCGLIPRLICLLVCSSLGTLSVRADDAAQAADKQAADESTNAEAAASDVEALKAEHLAKWQETGFPLMEAYCLDCHNEDLQEGGLDLSPFETLDNLTASEVERVFEMVQFGAMPPADYSLPDTEERKQLVAALEETMFSSTCDLRPQAGKVTVRRLNRSEYNNTIRDLFGLDLRPADQFPSDEVGAGFDNNSDVLSLSPMQIEKYIEAAESVSKSVIIDPDSLPELNHDVPGDQIPIYGEPAIGRFAGRFLAKDEFAWLDFKAPFDGKYRVDVRGGTTEEEQDPIRVAIYDGSGVLRAVDDLKHFGGGGSSQSFREEIELSAGEHRLYFVPIEDGAEELKVGESTFGGVGQMEAGRVKEIVARLGKPAEPTGRINGEEHPFMFRSFRVTGPRSHPRDAYPPRQFEICKHVAPGRPGRYRDVIENAMKNLKPVMRMAFRGPVSDEDVRPYAQLVEQATKEDKTFHRGMQIALSAVLVSPRFLFRVETPGEDVQPSEFGDVQLTQHQLASRLSFFLWSSTPDEALLDDADEGRLQGDRIEYHVTRMLKDPKSDSLATEFAAQWLGLRNLEQHEADEKKFPGFDGELRKAMVRETESLFLHVLRNNLSVNQFLTADYSFVNQELAEHYEIDLPGTPEGFQKVSLTDSPRRGLLAHGSILTLTSTPTRTSPVLRGKWILENVLGIKPPEPPAGVPALEDNEQASKTATLREQLELHRQSPTCASCHRVMDELGFGLDDFDAVGRYRTSDRGQPIDASGALPDGRKFNGGVELSSVLGKTETAALARTLIRRMMTFALGRELTPDDRCTIDEIFAKTEPEHFRLADIVHEIVASRQFQFQTISSDLNPKG